MRSSPLNLPDCVRHPRKGKGQWWCLSTGAPPALGSAGPRAPESSFASSPTRAGPTDFCRRGPDGPKAFLSYFLWHPRARPLLTRFHHIPHRVLTQPLARRTGLDFCNALDMKQPWAIYQRGIVRAEDIAQEQYSSSKCLGSLHPPLPGCEVFRGSTSMRYLLGGFQRPMQCIFRLVSQM